MALVFPLLSHACVQPCPMGSAPHGYTAMAVSIFHSHRRTQRRPSPGCKAAVFTSWRHCAEVGNSGKSGIGQALSRASRMFSMTSSVWRSGSSITAGPTLSTWLPTVAATVGFLPVPCSPSGRICSEPSFLRWVCSTCSATSTSPSGSPGRLIMGEATTAGRCSNTCWAIHPSTTCGKELITLPHWS